MTSQNSVTAAAAFIDLATFSELESFLYGGPHAISWFVAGVQKANWFSKVAICLRNNGTFGFGQENVSSCVNRSGDYVLNLWFRCEIPSITYTAAQAGTASAYGVRWTRNLMHNLIKSCSITFNELIVEEFDNYWLDFSNYYTLPAEKRIAYDNMIGNVATMTNFITSDTANYANANLSNPLLNQDLALWGGYFSVPLKFWFAEDSGIALPVAALPFNDVKVNFCFRQLSDLLVFNGPNATNTGNNVSVLTGFFQSFNTTGSSPSMSITPVTPIDFRHAYTHAHYAVIHNDERTKMGDAPRDQLIRQVQTVCGANLTSGATENVFDIRLSHSIVSFFFALRNKTFGEFSNYTTNINYKIANNGPFGAPAQQGAGSQWWNPIHSTELLYENTTRVNNDSDFLALIHPFYWSDAVPEETGVHMWTYALKPWEPLSPSGSTNYSKLANVQVRERLSNRAQYYLANSLGASTGTATGPLPNLLLHSVFVATNHNIARIANGSLGHPTL